METQTKQIALELLRVMITSREVDQREGILLRQGRGWFQVSATGHEALAALAFHLHPDDYIFSHYRDRSLMIAKGLSVSQLARDYFARTDSSSGGRNLPAHYSSRELNIFSAVSPAGSHCLPAVGCAWGFRLNEEGVLENSQLKRNSIVVCCIGDASVRQGEFFEAYTFAIQEQLPVVFVIEDNGYGISTPTKRMLPFRLEIFDRSRLVLINARDPHEVHTVGGQIIERVRSGNGPILLWCELDRLCSHTSSDDQRVYRSSEEIDAMNTSDPIKSYSSRLIQCGELTERQRDRILEETRESVETAYSEVEKEPLPDPGRVMENLFGPQSMHGEIPFGPRDCIGGAADSSGLTMVAAINKTFHSALERFPNMLIFGEDIEDPKGGVFRLTAGLSSSFPGRVINSPLAEATIIGLGAGLAATGFRPVLEVQFIDFMTTGFNQLVSQVTTMRWRSNGQWKCPLVIYAPYGAYLPAGGMWHSQSNDGWWAHTPGLRIAIPSTPADAVGLFWAAFQDEDPSLILIPKHLFRARVKTNQFEAFPFGKAVVRRVGSDVTLVSWGSCMDLVYQAAEAMAEEGVSVEVIDLRTLVPCDWETIELSLRKTGRLVVVHEDNRTCGFGQAIITEMTAQPERFQLLLSSPQLVARLDVYIPFCPALEYAALPDMHRVVTAIHNVME
ncbi:MAG: thiamine pyrophosphate-dependent enzyme [Terriglobia bacterium]